MPVPSVSRMTVPARPRAAPKASSAIPAASASLTMSTGRPIAALMLSVAGQPTQPGSMFAALARRPSLTIPGRPQPTGSTSGTSSPSSSARPPGRWPRRRPPGWMAGGSSRGRAALSSSAVARSTSAALTPVPPTSMPRAGPDRRLVGEGTTGSAPGSAVRSHGSSLPPISARPRAPHPPPWTQDTTPRAASADSVTGVSIAGQAVDR